MWKAATADVDAINRLLRTLIVLDKYAYVTIGPEGLKVQAWKPSQSLSGQLFLDGSLFAEYTFTFAQPVLLKLSLSALVRCLAMYLQWDSNTGRSLRGGARCFLSYRENEKFELHYAHTNLTSRCRLNLLDLESLGGSDIVLDLDQVLVQAIIPSPVLVSTLKDLDAVGTENVTISARTDPPRLIFHSESVLATSRLELPNDANVIEAYHAERNSSFEYAYREFATARDSIRGAKRVSLRYDAHGTLSIQCMHEIKGCDPTFVEIRLLPLERT